MHIGKNIFQKIAENENHETEDDIDSTREVSSAKQANTNIREAKMNIKENIFQKITKTKNQETEDDINSKNKKLLSESNMRRSESKHIISESVTPDPEVANHDNITIEYSYHNDLPHSVQNDTQEPKLPLENQQSTIINQNNISESANKSQAPSINSILDIKVNKQFNESNEQLTHTPNLAVANHDNIQNSIFTTTRKSQVPKANSEKIKGINQAGEALSSILISTNESQISKANSEKIEGINQAGKALSSILISTNESKVSKANSEKIEGINQAGKALSSILISTNESKVSKANSEKIEGINQAGKALSSILTSTNESQISKANSEKIEEFKINNPPIEVHSESQLPKDNSGEVENITSVGHFGHGYKVINNSIKVYSTVNQADKNRTLKLYNSTQTEDKGASLRNGQKDTSEFLSSLINNNISTPTAISTNKYEVPIAGAKVPNSEIEIRTEIQTKLKSEARIIATTRDMVEAMVTLQ